MSILKIGAQGRISKISLDQRLNRKGYMFVMPFIVLYAVFNLFPLIYTLILSFFSWNGIGEKTWVGLNNYIKLITTDTSFFKSLGNVFVIVLGYLPITLVLAFLIAILLYSKSLKLRRMFQTSMFLPYVVVPVAVGMLFTMMFSWQSGTVNTLLQNLGLIKEPIDWLGSQKYAQAIVIAMQVWKTLGYVVTLYLAALSSIPQDVIEAAAIDGAKFRHSVFKIILPLLKPITIFIVITTMIDGLQIFDAVKVLFTAGNTAAALGGPGHTALTPVWYLYYSAFGSSASRDFGYASAISYVLFMIIAIFSLVIMIPRIRKNQD